MLRKLGLVLLCVLSGGVSHALEGTPADTAENEAPAAAPSTASQSPALARQNAQHETSGKAARQGIRLLYLEPVAPTLTTTEREILAGLLFDALGGRDEFLLITGEDLRRRAPMEAERIDVCREELCLYEFAENVGASHVLFSEIEQSEAGDIQLDIAMFHLADAEIRSKQTLRKDAATAFSGFVRPAVQNVLSEALGDSEPKLLENPFFLGSVSVLSFGTMAGLAALGYALELESALARPDVHRSEKERALAQGPPAIWLGIASASIAAAGLMATGAALVSHYGSTEE